MVIVPINPINTPTSLQQRTSL